MGIVRIPGQLAPNGLFPIVDSNDIKGGFYIVDSIEERDNINPLNRKIGLPCYVVNENMYYRLKDGITNDCWDDWDLDNNGIIINSSQGQIKKDIILDIDHVHDNVQCTVLKDEDGNKFHTETNTDLVIGKDNKTLTEMLNYLMDKVNDTNDMPVEKIQLNKNSLIIKTGSFFDLKAEIFPKEHTEEIIWISSNSDIATIDNGHLIAIKPGNVFIKAISNKTRVYDTCSIIVAREDSNVTEVTNGLICDLNADSDKSIERWDDSTGNFNHADLIGFDEHTGSGFIDDYLYLNGSQYLKMQSRLLNDEISTIEIVADFMCDDEDSLTKIFAKKTSFSDMNYQISTESLSCGSNGVIKEFQNLNVLKGMNLYTFIINKISKKISVYINGRLYDIISLSSDEDFGTSITSPLLIANNGETLSSSKMKINRIRIFNKALTEDEILMDSEFLTGFFDGIENAIHRHACSMGRWSDSFPCYNIEDKYYRKSYKEIHVKDNTRYKLTLINSNYTGIANANGFDTECNKYIDLSYLIYFNNGVAEFCIPKEVSYFNFYLKHNISSKTNIYYTLEEINL